MEVGERIRFFREKKKMTKNELANRAGVSPTYIYQLEKGEKSPTVEYLGYVCEALGVSLNVFFSSSAVSFNKLDSLSFEQKRSLNDFLNTL